MKLATTRLTFNPGSLVISRISGLPLQAPSYPASGGCNFQGHTCKQTAVKARRSSWASATTQERLSARVNPSWGVHEVLATRAAASKGCPLDWGSGAQGARGTALCQILFQQQIRRFPDEAGFRHRMERWCQVSEG